MLTSVPGRCPEKFPGLPFWNNSRNNSPESFLDGFPGKLPGSCPVKFPVKFFGQYTLIFWSLPNQESGTLVGLFPRFSGHVLTCTIFESFPDHDRSFPNIFWTFSEHVPVMSCPKHFSDILRQFSGNFPVISRSFPDSFRSFRGQFPDIFRTCSRHFPDISEHFPDAF